jgi:glucose-6-phosphate 1-dehydrogenase
MVYRSKEPGPGMALDAVPMDFSYRASFRSRPAEAYERLLHDAMATDQTLFLREDGVVRSWEIGAADDLIAPRVWRAVSASRRLPPSRKH